MLQRAASNAYSWWWASHIRTKQSKWLEQNLQDLEEKVAYTLKLIEEDGDSFAKRAEMYYKKRPELIAFVEEAYRAYRALAERYDHISTELQNANNTIAAVFPDQVHFVDEDDEDASPRVIKRSDVQKGNIPNVPKAPLKDLRSVVTTASRLTSATKKLRPSKSRKAAAIVAKSGLTKDEGLKEIGNLQKKILALQTEKEFVKSSYEDKLAKYWDIENKIKEMQGRVYRLQDEFGAGIVIEDEEARTLMASTALKSCQETLTKLKEKHEGSAEEAKVEPKKIKDTQGKLQSIQDELSGNETSQTRPSAEDDSVKAVEGSTTQGGEELGPSQEKIKEQLEVGSGESLTVEEMAEKIDELVNKVVSLDTAFSSQTSLIERLQTETNELQTQIQILEGEKETLINGKNELSNKLVMMEEDLQRLQGLNCNVKDQNNYLQTFSTEAHSPQFNADKLQSLKPDEEIQHSSEKEDKSTFQGKLQEIDGHEGALNPNDAPEILQNVKLPEESEVKPLWEKDKTPQKEMSTNQVKSQKEIDGQESDSNDGLQRQQSVKLPESEVKPSSEKDKTPQKEEMSTIQAKTQKEIDGQESELNSNDDLQRQQSVRLPEKSEVEPSSEKDKTPKKEEMSTIQVKLQKEIDGQESELNSNDDLHRQQSLKLPEESEVEPSSEKDRTPQKEETSTIQIKLQKEIDGQESELNSNDDLQRQQIVKQPEESEVEPSSEKDKTPQKEETSTIQVKSQKEIDRQEGEVNSNDGLQRQQSVKLLEESEVKPSAEKDKTPQKEEMSTIQVKSQKEIDGQEGEMDSNNGLQGQQSVKLLEEHEVQNSPEKEKTSPVEVQFQKQLEGSECAPKLADDKQQCEKPNEEFKVSGSIEKEEKAIGVQTEVAKHTKEHDLSTIPGNQGEVSSQPQSNIEPCNLLEKSPDQMTQEKVDNQASSQAPANSLNVEREEQETEPGDEPDGKKMLNGAENREKVLLTEYTKVSQNYMELKKKLDEEGIQTGEEGIKTGENTFEIKLQLEELRSANAKKDEEIRALREKLRILQALANDDNNLDDQCAEQKVTVSETPRTTTEEEDIKVIPVDQSQTASAIEEKFRMSIDELLEENLDFWLRFSTTFHQIQKFETEVKDLEAEVSKVQDRKKKHSDSSSIKYSLRSDIRPLYNHLREIQTELTLWMEKSALLKEELTDRFSSLCNIQEEITGALRLSAEDYDFKFTSYQAAKFQGEVLNMKQENNKVADELQAGLDHVTTLQIDLEKTLTSLSEEFGLAESKSDSNIELDHADSKTRVPLRSFIFGVKPKKQKSSFLSCMHPALAKKYNGLRSGSSR